MRSINNTVFAKCCALFQVKLCEDKMVAVTPKEKAEVRMGEFLNSKVLYIKNPVGKDHLLELFSKVLESHQKEGTRSAIHLAKIQKWIENVPNSEEGRRAIYNLLIQWYDDGALRGGNSELLEFIKKGQDRNLSTAKFGRLENKGLKNLSDALLNVQKPKTLPNRSAKEKRKGGDRPKPTKKGKRACWNCGLATGRVCKAKMYADCKHKLFQPAVRRYAGLAAARTKGPTDEFLS